MSGFLDLDYIDNRNIRRFCLYKDGLHLLEKGKKFFANDFLSHLNRYFLGIHVLSAPSTVIEQKYQFLEGSELQILLKDRERYYKNPLIGYLNKNSLRNKIIDMRIILQDLQLNYFVLSETKLDKQFSYQPISLKWVRNKVKERLK